jgi:hypothetical protein
MISLFRSCSLVALISLISCGKTAQTLSYPGYYGQWQYIGYSFIGFSAPSADSTVILTLSPGNTYKATLNGMEKISGTFSIDSGSNGQTLTFSHITQPYGNMTTSMSGTTTYLYFNYSKVGQLTLFENNWIRTASDTLVLQQTFLAPEFTSNYFRRIQ